MKKRIISILLCLFLCAGMLPGAALASEEPELLPAAEPMILSEPLAEEAVVQMLPEEEAPAAEESEISATEEEEAPAHDGGDTVSVTYGDSSSSGEMGGGPSAASKSFFVELDVTYPDDYTGDGYVVFQVDKDNDFAALDEHYKDGDTIEISEGEWALFGYEEINGETAAWQGSTMGNGLYGLADEPSEAGTTVTLSLVYGEETQDSGGSEESPAVDPYAITLDITYPEGYEGEDAGGIQFSTSPAEPEVVTVKGDGTVSDTYEAAKTFSVLSIPGLVVEDMTVTCSCAEDCSHVQEATRPDGIVDYTVSGNVTVTIVYGEIDYSAISVWLDQPAEGDVGLFSALLTTRYSMPSYMDHNIVVYYSRVDSEDPREMNQYNNYTGSFSLRQDSDGNYYFEEEINCLLPDTEYYARAVLMLQDYTVVSEPIKFTTDAGTCDTMTVAPVAGEYTEEDETIPCTVNGEEQDIVFPSMDGLNGADGVSNVAIVQLNVTEDGVYRITLNYEEPATLPAGYAYIFSRLYTMDDNGDLQSLENASISETVAAFFVGDPPGPGDGTSEWDHTYADIELSKDVTYYLALDLGAGTGTVSVAKLNPNRAVEFTITANPAHYGSDDSKPHAVRAVVNYTVSSYYSNGYVLDVRYGRKAVYEETGEFEMTARWHNPPSYQAHDDWEEKVRLSYCIDGLEYVYIARLMDCATGDILAESEVVEFVADMTYIRSLKLGENRNTIENRVVDADGNITECFSFGSDVVMNRFTPEETGRYLFNANGNQAVIEVYDAAGDLLATSTAGLRWASVALELTGGTDYYVIVMDLTCVTPIVTVSFLQSAVATDDAVEVSDGGVDVALDSLESAVNDLTKDEEGNAAELPDYVEADETGEAALRTAIETGEALTAEVTGEAVEETEVDEETVSAMEETAANSSVDESAEAVVYLELAVLLKDGETELACITETEEEITFAIPLTDELREQIAGKSVFVIREHEGVTEVLAAEVSEEDGYIYFSSSLFSTFGLFTAGELLNGFVEKDGVLYYYIEGIPFKGGLFEVDGEFYYARTTNGEIIRSQRYWTTCANTEITGYAPGFYRFDAEGRMIKSVKNGFVEEDGVLYYYINDVRFCGGLFEVDGEFYYARTTNGEIICGRGYWVTRANTEITGYASGYYTFDELGRMVRPETSVTEFVEEDGVLYYYINNVRFCGGLFEVDGAYYYARTSNGEIVRSCRYWVTCTNGLLAQGCYEFDADGKILLD